MGNALTFYPHSFMEKRRRMCEASVADERAPNVQIQSKQKLKLCFPAVNAVESTCSHLDVSTTNPHLRDRPSTSNK